MARIEKRNLADGSPRYKAIIRRKGSPLLTRTFRTKAQAQKWATSMEHDMIDEREMPSREEQRRTLGELVDRYIEEQLPGKKSGKDQSRILTWWKGRIGDRRLIEVTPALLSEIKGELSRGRVGTSTRRPATVNRYLAYLSHAFTVAVKEWQWLRANPMLRVSRLPEPRGRIRFLSEDERSAEILDACKTSDEPLFSTLLFCSLSPLEDGRVNSLVYGGVTLTSERKSSLSMRPRTTTGGRCH